MGVARHQEQSSHHVKTIRASGLDTSGLQSPTKQIKNAGCFEGLATSYSPMP